VKIHPETVTQIKQATDIVEVVGDFVTLKKRGANYQACCPFHNEKTPSFSVNPVRQIFKCFGCGAAGDAIKFVMDIDGIGYTEALKYLAGKYSIDVREEEVTDEQTRRQNERESLFIVLGFARSFFQRNLLETDEGKAIGLSYFRERGFTDPVISRFELGYSPETRDALTNEALSKGYTSEALVNAGLSIRKDDVPEDAPSAAFDRFRGRVIFPIHNVSGKVIAFGGRILRTDKKTAKYINSPETAVYHKSDVLYGIYQAKNAIRQQDLCYLVEGYTDVISLHQGGIENVVASSGTSLTIEQIRLISRFTPNITILYDGDDAGIKAALRGLDLVLEEGLNVSIVTFPDREDPDSYMRRVGAGPFREYIRTAAKDFITFKTEVLLKDAGEDPFKKAALISEVVESIMKIPHAIQRQVFFGRVAERMKIGEDMLISEGNKILRKKIGQQQKEKERASSQRVSDALAGLPSEEAIVPAADPAETPAVPVQAPARSSRHYQEEASARLLVLFGTVELEPGVTVCHYILQEVQGLEFLDERYSRLMRLCRDNFEKGMIPDTDYYVHHDTPEIRELAIHWVTPKYEVSNLWFDKHEIYVPTELDMLEKNSMQSMFRLLKTSLDEEMHTLIARLNEDLDETECTTVQVRYLEIKSKSLLVSRELGMVFG